ncbi:MAG TPA: CBS domain-containing protein [Tepidiformaceae bacterium]|nr:CBS domain-containing protein [Tepidiformaceae bacterium]
MQTERKNIVICPSCGAENIEGADTCENCMSDLRSLDVPAAFQIAPDTELTRHLGELRLTRPSTILRSATVREAVSALKTGGNGAVVIVDGDAVVGIFTDRDVLKRIAGEPGRLDEPIDRYMTHDPVVLRDTDTMAAALNKMGDGGFRHIPMVRDGKLTGMATGRNVMQWLLGRYFDPSAE